MVSTITAGIAPGVALLSYFYLKDKYEAEPLSLVAKVFFLGALLVFPIMFIHYVLTAENIIPGPIFESFLSVGFLEEFFKWFIVYYTVYRHQEFNEPYDGIVYSTAVSLGFASAENILYLLANGVEFALSRALLPVSSHALFGVMMGYYIGKAKFTKDFRLWLLFLSIMVPALLHGGYTYILLTIKNWFFPITIYMVILWFIGIRKTKLANYLSDQFYKNRPNKEKPFISH
ncbi:MULTISPECIES: glutamic-type intramembrane protease PrsW [Mesobacillus]|uniref:Protease PrsW n=1 Tax=Mesobacillus subterraneus TaxID=285983 RepID=A0A0D6ZEF7_9BACI|nr:glutamic-type intramembrane protease PrsW [Mesobacillus subterraneus]KIY23670.1 protease [Mesobacillus subterraneus]